MVEVKNLRSGVVVLAGSRLRFRAGEVREVPGLSPEIERAIELGLLVRVGAKSEAGPEPEPARREPTGPAKEDDGALEDGEEGDPDTSAGLDALLAPEAIQAVDNEDDPARLEAWLLVENRRGVKKTIRNRIDELHRDTG